MKLREYTTREIWLLSVPTHLWKTELSAGASSLREQQRGSLSGWFDWSKTGPGDADHSDISVCKVESRHVQYISQTPNPMKSKVKI